MATLVASAWPPLEPLVEDREGLDKEVDGIGRIMVQACDAAMPRSRSRAKRAAYWWSAELQDLRSSAARARRILTAARRHGADGATKSAAHAAWREARGMLRVAIGRAKALSWDKLMSEIDRDPWGRPYKIVMRRLGPQAPPPTESLNPPLLDTVIGTLFPMGDTCLPPYEGPAANWREEWGVTDSEVATAARRLGAKGKAPGPDGVPGRAWALAMGILAPRMRRLFEACLRAGVFPSVWKRARLVLLRKEGKPEGSPSAYRPICLLDEAGKMFERIIARRLVQHLEGGGPNLDDEQFGFREGRSTIDAILRVRSLSEAAAGRGGVMLAVSLDIANAFNSLPWDRVEAGLMYHRVPSYLVLAIRDYFRGRWLEFRDKSELQRGRSVYCGVPQGSVLGPLLWNVAYGTVLRTALPPGCSIVCYADDTLVLAGGRSWDEALALGRVATDLVVHAIRLTGLEVAPSKTEVMFLHDGSRGDPPPGAGLMIGSVRVKVGHELKYLGLTLDGTWGFRRHFELLAPRVGRAANALGSLLPNIGGPKLKSRRLYANVVHAMVLYGAPVWAGEMRADRKIQQLLRSAQRWIAIRLVRAYRTVSHAAATVLAGVPPLELLAQMYAELYARRAELREEVNLEGMAGAITMARKQARQRLVLRWRVHLRGATGLSGRRVADAVLPCLEEWLGRAHGSLSFRTTQMLTGHGCFAAYLCRIGREGTTNCHHCDDGRDDAQHTLEACPAWGVQRRELVAVVGGDLSPPALVKAMLRGQRVWSAVASFCEVVISRKEAAERIRRGEVLPPGGARGGRPPRRGPKKRLAHTRGIQGARARAMARADLPIPPTPATRPPGVPPRVREIRRQARRGATPRQPAGGGGDCSSGRGVGRLITEVPPPRAHQPEHTGNWGGASVTATPLTRRGRP